VPEGVRGRNQRFAKPSQGVKLCRDFKSLPLREGAIYFSPCEINIFCFFSLRVHPEIQLNIFLPVTS
jgi:hypothetical protein